MGRRSKRNSENIQPQMTEDTPFGHKERSHICEKQETKEHKPHGLGLRQLQPSSDNSKVLVGGRRSTQPTLYENEPECDLKVKKWHHKTIQTEALPQEKQQDSSEFITSEEPSLEYWKKLAEERRKALDEALKENEELWEKVHELEKEKAAMELIVNEAKAMAEMLQEVTNEDES